MIKHLCTGLVAAACLAGPAGAADLSMTPIYKSRPSAAAVLDGRLKAEYQRFTLNPSRPDRPFMSALAGMIAKLRRPTDDRAARSGTGGPL